MRKLNGNMLLTAREARQMTQAEVARAAGITQGALSRFENGTLDPEPETIVRLADVLGYPEAFFFESLPTVDLPYSFFRKRVSLPAKISKMVRAQMNILRLWVARLSSAAELPEVKLPAIDLEVAGLSPEDAARLVRSHWGIPRGPIESMVDLLEDAGVLVVESDFGSPKFDGFSVFEKNTGLPPTVFLNPDPPGDRERFTLAHELGHLILHTGLVVTDPERDVETEADRFAAEFLAPAADIKGHLGRITLADLARLKLHWKISIGSLLMCADRLGRITPSQKRRLWMQMSSLGYRTKEPNPIARETPKLFTELIEFHLGELGYTEQELADHLRVTAHELRAKAGLNRPGLTLVK